MPLRRRDDQESAPDQSRREVHAPRVRPVFVGERYDLQIAGRREAELAKAVEVAADVRLERGAGDGLGKERAKPGTGTGPLLNDW